MSPGKSNKFQFPSRLDIALPREVADALGVTVNALTQMRYRGVGPSYTRVASRIRYRWSDVQKYLDEQTVKPGA
jgi:hypothetical protein